MAGQGAIGEGRKKCHFHRWSKGCLTDKGTLKERSEEGEDISYADLEEGGLSISGRRE